MPISNAGAPSPTQRAWWLLPEATVLVLLLVLLAGGMHLSLAPAASAGLNDRLSDVIVQALERGTPADHHSHGHTVQPGWTVECTAEVYGTDPRGATSIDKVKNIYGYYMCAAGAPGTPWAASSRSTGPCMVRMANPPRVLTVLSGQGYEARVRAMLPDEYEAWAFQGFRDKEKPARLIQRYNQTIAVATPLPSSAPASTASTG